MPSSSPRITTTRNLQANRNAQNNQNQYEMQNYGQQQPAPPRTLSQQDFLSRVSYTREQILGLTQDIEQIGMLHQRALSSTDPNASRDLDGLVSSTQIRNGEIKDSIKSLEADLAKTSDGTRSVKKTQLESLKNLFKQELEKYQHLERDYERRYRDQIARQYRIVNPDASEEEVQEASQADWGNEGVFQTAVSNTDPIRPKLSYLAISPHPTKPTIPRPTPSG
jgi:syntaxin 1B/2/3